MAKQQAFIHLYSKYSEDNNGQVGQQQLIKIISQLELPYQYPGSINKMIRKMNYKQPNKNTLNFNQTQEYINALQTTSKYQIWKLRYSLLNSIEDIKLWMKQQSNQQSNAAPSAAPTQTQQSDTSPTQGKLTILVGQSKPTYESQLCIQIQKDNKQQKIKPFLKIIFTSTTQQRAKQLQQIFKQTLNIIINLFKQQQPQFADLANQININSFTNLYNTTFFITTKNQDIINYLHLISQGYQLAFSTKILGEGKLKFQFDYNFQKYILEQSSNFYDIFTKTCKLTVDVKFMNIFRSLKQYCKLGNQLNDDLDEQQQILLTSLLHIQNLQGLFQFDNSQQTQYQIQTKQQINQLINYICSNIFKILAENGGVKIKQLLEYLDHSFNLQFNIGQWKISTYAKLKNINKIFLYFYNALPSQHNYD